MVDRVLATVGLAFAGVAAVAGLRAWPLGIDGAGVAGLATLLGAAVAALAFSVGRHGRGRAEVIAGTAGAGAAFAVGGASFGLFGFALGSYLTSNPPALAALGASVGALVVAGAIARDVPRARFFLGTRLFLLGAGLGTIGLYLAGMTALLAVAAPEAVWPDLDPLAAFGLRQVGVGAGFVLTALGYLVLSGRGIGYLDVDWPARRDVHYMAGGIVVILFVGALVAIIYWLVDVPTTEHALHRRGREEGAEFILLAIPFTWVGAVIGEELLYRNVVQKHLTDGLSAATGIVASSAIFALVHVPAYSPAAPLSVAAAVGAVFAISLVLAVAYHRTQNVLVPMVIHGCYNVIVYVAIYLELTGVV